MRAEGEVRENVLPFPAARKALPGPADLRFRALLGEEAWNALPQAVRTRFGSHIGHCHVAVYTGEVLECRISWAGRILAQAARLIGAPLPLGTDTCVPAVVAVTEDPAGGGQFWTRSYGRLRGFPQVIHSVKRFSGPTGLEEYIGRGVGIALRLCVQDEALHFDSDHYFTLAGTIRMRIPRWLAPGALRISHVDCGHDQFAFVLDLRHPLAGELIHQTVMFRDMAAAQRTE